MVDVTTPHPLDVPSSHLPDVTSPHPPENPFDVSSAQPPDVSSSHLTEATSSHPTAQSPIQPVQPITNPIPADIYDDIIGNDETSCPDDIFSEPSCTSKRKYRKSYGYRSPSLKSPNNKKVFRESKCPCSRTIPDSVKITCQSCKQLFHSICVGLNGLDQANVNQLISWKCFSCFKPPFAKADNVEYRTIVQEELEHVCSTTMKELVVSATQEAIKKATKALVEEVSKKTNESVKTFAEVTVGKTREVQKKIIDDVKEATASTVVIGEVCRKMDNDQIEREKRKCNVIINKIPEPKSTLNGRDKKDHDMQFVCNNLGMVAGDIKACFRTGSPLKTKDGMSLPRPLVVIMKDEETAKYWHDYGRGYHVEGTDTWINPDLCKADRHLNFLMREERRSRLRAAPPPAGLKQQM